MAEDDELPVIRGLELRYVLVLALLGRDAPMTVSDLVRAVRRAGFVPPGRPSKGVADALRWELRRGRVRRVGRGTYVAGYVAKVTRHRMRVRVAQTWNRTRPPGSSDVATEVLRVVERRPAS